MLTVPSKLATHYSVQVAHHVGHFRPHRMDGVQRCYKCSVISVYVCLLDTTASPIQWQMPFGLWTRVVSSNRVLCEDPVTLE